jgi:hypothetical protein
MKKRDLEFFRKMLKQQLEELTQKSDATIVGLLNSTVSSVVLMAESRMPWSLACMQHTTISSEKRNCLLSTSACAAKSTVRFGGSLVRKKSGLKHQMILMV